MVKNKDFLYDPSLYAILLFNVYLIYYYQSFPTSIHAIILLYWVQSVLIGVFNVVDMLTGKPAKTGSLKMNGAPASQGCAALFFVVHYGIFHFVYLIFLSLTHLMPAVSRWQYLVNAFWILLAGMTLEFIQTKFRFRNKEKDLGTMFFLPYLRIIPMHLMILVPSLLHVSGYMLFLILKTIFDLIGHVAYNKMLYKEATS